MKQLDGVRTWWAELDEVDRARVLRNDDDLLRDDGLLAEDLALCLAGYGVSVVAAFASEVDGRPDGRPGGWFWPPVLDDFVAGLRGEPAGPGPRGRLCQGCGEPVDDEVDAEDGWVEIPVLAGLSFVLHAQCASTATGDLPGP